MAAYPSAVVVLVAGVEVGTALFLAALSVAAADIEGVCHLFLLLVGASMLPHAFHRPVTPHKIGVISLAVFPKTEVPGCPRLTSQDLSSSYIKRLQRR